MDRAPVRAAIVGIGAIGGLFAAGLARAGWDVSALARGATLDALRGRGLRIVGESSASRAAKRRSRCARATTRTRSANRIMSSSR